MLAVPITRYRYRGTKIPNPWVASHAERPTPWRARCMETARRVRRAAWGRTDGNIGTAPQADSITRSQLAKCETG